MRPGAHCALDVPLGLELLERVDDGSARKPILPGQVARRWQARSGV